MKIMSILGISIVLLIVGCAPIQPTFEDSNQYFLERTIDKLNIGDEIKGKIPKGSKVAFVSIEKNTTLDEPIIAMIEDQMIQSLVNSGFFVVERDAEAIQKLIREGKDKYSLTYEQSTDGMMFEKVTGDMVKPGINFVETQLSSADYVISYRILEAGILYRKDIDVVDSDFEKREGLVRLHIRVQGAQSGEVKYSANLTGKLEDKVRKEFVVPLASFHYSFFPYEYPLQPKKQVKVLKEIRSAASGSFRLLPRIGFGFHSEGSGMTLGGMIGYGSDSWGSINVDVMWLVGNDVVGNAFMLVYEKPYRQFLLQGGIGFTRVEWESYDYEYEYDYYDGHSARSFGLRLGVGYEFPIGSHFVLKPAYELNLGFEEKSSFSGINLNFGWK